MLSESDGLPGPFLGFGDRAKAFRLATSGLLVRLSERRLASYAIASSAARATRPAPAGKHWAAGIARANLFHFGYYMQLAYYKRIT